MAAAAVAMPDKERKEQSQPGATTESVTMQCILDVPVDHSHTFIQPGDAESDVCQIRLVANGKTQTAWADPRVPAGVTGQQTKPLVFSYCSLCCSLGFCLSHDRKKKEGPQASEGVCRDKLHIKDQLAVLISNHCTAVI